MSCLSFYFKRLTDYPAHRTFVTFLFQMKQVCYYDTTDAGPDGCPPPALLFLKHRKENRGQFCPRPYKPLYGAFIKSCPHKGTNRKKGKNPVFIRVLGILSPFVPIKRQHNRGILIYHYPLNNGA